MEKSYGQKVAERLWVKMTEAYGNEWPRKFGDEPTEAWIAAMAEYDARLIGQAIEQCTKQKAHPPTLAEFIQYVKAQHMTTAEWKRENEFRKPLTEAEKKAGQEAIKKAAPKVESGSRRNVLLPNESYADFQKKMAEAKVSGIPEKEFRRQRLLQNGWTDEDEQRFIQNLQIVGKYAQLGP